MAINNKIKKISGFKAFTSIRLINRAPEKEAMAEQIPTDIKIL